jgi:outer membrane protein assembly factor BamB
VRSSSLSFFQIVSSAAKEADVRRSIIVILALTLLTLRPVSATDQWPQFRGLQAGVADDDPALPDAWSERDNVVWKVSIGGQGWSSPIVWGDHVFVTSAISSGNEPASPKGLYDPGSEHRNMKSSAVHRWVVHDVDFQTGRIRWMRELHSGTPAIAKQVRNSYASETLVTDGERVYVYLGSLGLVAALDLNGRTLWTKDVGAFESQTGWGTAASPILHKDRLYIVNDNRSQSFIAAFDKNTGDEVWKVTRDEVEGYSTPVVWENELRTEIVTTGMRRVRSYSLDGKLLWELAGMSDILLGPIPTPFVKHGLVYISSGYPGSARRPVFAIRPGGSGDISLKPGETSNQHVAWFQPLLGSYQTSALVYGNYYYTLLDRGFLLCHDARTGKQVYGRHRLSADASGFAASPWAYNGRIFALSEDGDTYVVQAGPEFKLLGKNSLNEMALASPAVARGSLFIRTQSSLYRISKTVQQ